MSADVHGCPACQTCPFNAVCRAAHPELGPDGFTPAHHDVRAGEKITNQGAPILQVYPLRTGATKAVFGTAMGTDQIVGFGLPGDVIGLEREPATRHDATAVATQPCSVCIVSIEASHLAMDDRKVLRAVQAMRAHAHEARLRLLVTIACAAAYQRLAQFLVELDDLQRQRGISPPILLPMTRGDIGNYLGLTLETVSRLFTAFARVGLIQVAGKTVRIVDPAGLRELSFGITTLKGYQGPSTQPCSHDFAARPLHL